MVYMALRVLTTLSSLCVSLSPAASMYKRFKAKDTGDFQIVPLLSMASNYMLISIYGMFIDNIFPLAITMFTCSMIGLFYSIVFVICTRNKANALRKCAIFAVPMTLVILYAILAAVGATNQSHANTGKVFGYLTIVTGAIFYTSPLLKIKHVLETKSAAVIPVAFCCVATINNALWATYGALIDNWIIGGTNSFCCFFGVLQVCLWIKYRPTRLNKKGAENMDDLSVSIVLTPSDQKHLGISAAESPTFQAIASPMVPIGLKTEPLDDELA